MQLEKLKAHMAEEGYIHSSEYSKLTGLTKAQVDDRINARRLEYKKAGRYIFIKKEARPAEYVDRQAWLTMAEYSARYGIPLKTVQLTVQDGRLESKKIGERWFVLGDVTLRREERIFSSGKRQIFWTQEEKQKCIKSA